MGIPECLDSGMSKAPLETTQDKTYRPTETHTQHQGIEPGHHVGKQGVDQPRHSEFIFFYILKYPDNYKLKIENVSLFSS